MAAFIIGYDIHPSRGESYEELIAAIKKIGPWWHHLDSTWIVLSDKTAGDIRDGLTPHLQKDDQLLVTKSSGVGAWFGFDDNGGRRLKSNL